MRYEKTDCALMCDGDFMESFKDRYQREFGFTLGARPVFVDDIRIRGLGSSKIPLSKELSNEGSKIPPSVETVTKVYFDDHQFHDVNVYMLSKLSPGHTITGPALIIDANSTIVVEPLCSAEVTLHGDVCINVGVDTIGAVVIDDILVSIFGHRFMSIAEQMGRVLQRTSISTNIKERLDFSCAVFGPDGGLVSNAPHIPVHLGAMQETVQYQMKELGASMRPGDVILSNHPCSGGSHLPDLTVITPVFYRGSERPVFYVASRGHHADIGGITPGSMPPHSKSIFEEGAVFMSFKLVSEGVFQEQAVTDALMEPGKYPGSSGTRNLRDNLSDLKAQVAANQKGINLLCELIDSYGKDVVQGCMDRIQLCAEQAVTDMLKVIGKESLEKTGKSVLQAEEYMDDGSKIALKVHIDAELGKALFDFTGTGYEVHGNCNAPRAITLSALIYCLRCMVANDIPLNQGCLKPVNTIVPEGSILSPSRTAAVVGGNVLTSQRVVDVIFKAFEACSASQGCMNNITFGDEEGSYYETVAGGAGAGPSWHGRSGIHTHMTNTRITDPEILEKRYPIILKNFHLRENSGGDGKYRGGDGVNRKLLFRKKMTLSVLTERRVFAPYGLKGGNPGKTGINLMRYNDGRIVNLGAKTSVDVSAGDVFDLASPGGGGWGQR